MRQLIEAAFPQVTSGGCLSTESKELFHVYDSLANRCFIRSEETHAIHFTVSNPFKKEISFLAIDNCLFAEIDGRRCDFALFNDSNFCFIEIKDIKGRQRRNARIQAQVQLSTTIRHFISLGIQFNGRLEAIVCFVMEKIYPATTAQSIDAVVEFEEEFGAYFLIGNSRDF